MTLLGFFDLNQRYEGPDGKNDRLRATGALVAYEGYCEKLKSAQIANLRSKDAERKSGAGRKLWGVAIFKAFLFQALYNLSFGQAEYQLRDRLSFTRFLGLGVEYRSPEAVPFSTMDQVSLGPAVKTPTQGRTR